MRVLIRPLRVARPHVSLDLRRIATTWGLSSVFILSAAALAVVPNVRDDCRGPVSAWLDQDETQTAFVAPAPDADQEKRDDDAVREATKALATAKTALTAANALGEQASAAEDAADAAESAQWSNDFASTWDSSVSSAELDVDFAESGVESAEMMLSYAQDSLDDARGYSWTTDLSYYEDSVADAEAELASAKAELQDAKAKLATARADEAAKSAAEAEARQSADALRAEATRLRGEASTALSNANATVSAKQAVVDRATATRADHDREHEDAVRLAYMDHQSDGRQIRAENAVRGDCRRSGGIQAAGAGVLALAGVGAAVLRRRS